VRIKVCLDPAFELSGVPSIFTILGRLNWKKVLLG
jgi:hypothetical protein